MPGLDGTGPMGMGPGTGGRRGLCYPQSRGFGLGLRRGFGRGFGFRARNFGVMNTWIENVPYDQKEYLQRQKEILEMELKAINDQLKANENTGKEE